MNNSPDFSFSSDRTRLFELLLKRTGISLPVSPPIPRSPDADAYPLSMQQQRLWSLLEEEACNEVVGLRMTGPLNSHALSQAICELARRHESLRTRFIIRDSLPRQQVLSNLDLNLNLNLVDLSALDPQDSHPLSSKLAAVEASQKLDLSTGPLMRVALFETSPHRHLLVICLHHIACDGWSKRLLINELLSLYSSYRAGQASLLCEPELQYRDYAVWQRRQARGEARSKAVEYWKKQLAGELPRLGLSTRASEAVGEAGPREGSCEVRVSKPVVEKLRKVCASEAATMHMVMMSGLKVILSRHSGQEDVIVGTVVADRGRREMEGVVGLMINTVAIRSEVREEGSFREVVRGVKEAAVGGYSHQEVSYEEVVAELEVEREVSKDPLMEVMMVMEQEEEGEGEEKEMGGVKVIEEEVEVEGGKYEMMVELKQRESKEGGEEIIGRIRYRRGRYEEERIRRMSEGYERVMEMVASDPDRKISTLPRFGDW